MSNFDIYRNLIEAHPYAELKGKKNPYTSVKGRMYTFLDIDDKLSIRLNLEDTEEYASKYEWRPSIQHDRIMKEYILVSPKMMENDKDLKYFFNKSFEHFNSMTPKPKKMKE
jgi:hypothetical protein